MNMKRISSLILLVATFAAAILTNGCVPMSGTPDGGGMAVGPCPTEGLTMLCTNASGCAGIQSCGCDTRPRPAMGCDPATLHWGLCTGPTSCAMPDSGTVTDGASGSDSGMIADSGVPDDTGTGVDGGMSGSDAGTVADSSMPGSDAGMPGTDAGPTCDPSIVRTCTGACGVPGATGFLLDSCDPASPCVHDLTDPTGGCTVVTPSACPPVGVTGAFLVLCHTVCDFTGLQSLADYCAGNMCYPVFPESCTPVDGGMSTPDGGMVIVDAGTDAFVPPVDGGTDSGTVVMMDAGSDAGSDAGTDAGNDAGSDAGSDAGTDAFVPPVDAGTDAFVAPMDAGTDSGPVGIPADVPLSGVYMRLDDTTSAHWCSGTETVEPWCWDNTGPLTSDLEHFGPPQLTVPVDASDMVLNGSPINSTVNCRYDTSRYSIERSPIILAATIGAPASSIGVHVYINHVEVPAFICWDSPTATRTDPNYHRIQFMASTTMMPTGCTPGTGS